MIFEKRQYQFFKISSAKIFFCCFLDQIHSLYDADRSPGMLSSYFRMSSTGSAENFVKMRHFSEILKKERKKEKIFSPRHFFLCYGNKTFFFSLNKHCTSGSGVKPHDCAKFCQEWYQTSKSYKPSWSTGSESSIPGQVLSSELYFPDICVQTVHSLWLAVCWRHSISVYTCGNEVRQGLPGYT